jgi:hypothetical protein
MLMPHFKSSRRIERQVLLAGVLRRAPQVAFQVSLPVLCLALLLAMQAGAQQNAPIPPMHNGFPPASSSRQPLGPDDGTTDDTAWQARQVRALNVERQKAMVSDTNKLLKLAHELDAEVSGTNSNSLSSDQLRKLAEIEKLAHSVKEKMSISLQGPSPLYPQQDPTMMPR